MIKVNDFPRRNIQVFQTPVERSLSYVAQDIESLGADPKLTDAIVLLEQVKTLVSDYIDDKLVQPQV